MRIDKNESHLKTPMQILLVIGVIIFMAELLVMMGLAYFPVESTLLEMFLDSLALTLLSAPFLYHFLIKKILLKNDQLITDLVEQKMALDTSTLVSVTDTKGIITYANEKFCAISGYTEAELIGHSHRLVNSQTHSLEFWKALWATISSGKMWEGEVCNRAKDGSLYWVAATIIPNFDMDGKIKSYTAIRIDITPLKQTQKQMQHNEKLATIGGLAAGVGHEINNPLSIAKGLLEMTDMLLRTPGPVDEKVFDKLHKIDLALDRIANIAIGLRAYSRKDDDQIGSYNVHEMISETLGLLTELYQKSSIKLEFKAINKNINVYGNRGRLQQVLMNLLANAKDATEGVKDRYICIKLESNSETLSISVSDNGHGIPDAIKGKIFDPFYTTKGVNKGTGLGLSLSSTIIKEHNGSLTVDGQLGVGTTFLMVLPLAPIDQNKVAAPVMTKIQVLVVDDEEDLREIYQFHLTKMGLTVQTAVHGEMALEMMKNTQFDLILSDVTMPVMDGFQFLETLLAAKNLNPPRFMFITGGTVKGNEKLQQMSDQVDGLIIKPFKPDVIREKLIALFPGKIV